MRSRLLKRGEKLNIIILAVDTSGSVIDVSVYRRSQNKHPSFQSDSASITFPSTLGMTACSVRLINDNFVISVSHAATFLWYALPIPYICSICWMAITQTQMKCNRNVTGLLRCYDQVFYGIWKRICALSEQQVESKKHD